MSMTTIREQKHSLFVLTDRSVVLRVREKDMGQEDEQLMLCSGHKLGALTGVCLDTLTSHKVMGPTLHSNDPQRPKPQ